MKTKVLTALLLAAAFGLTACKDAPPPDKAAAAAPAKAASAPVTLEAIAAEAKGFTFGSPMSVRTVYVFFDAQCPHCGVLWNAAKPLKSQAKFVWIPVGLLNKTSTSQGAALLAATDPVATMDEHEASLLDKKGGMSVSGDNEAQKAMIAKNTELFNRFGFASVPTIVGAHSQTGAIVKQEGAVQTAALAGLLGLQVPAGQ